MARYDSQHKEATRSRILRTAGHRLKSDGIDGAGVATLMKDAGLTNGAFYAHFDSKEHLVAEVVSDQLTAQQHQLDGLAPGPPGVEELVRAYLTTGHRDAPADGCASAALLDEIARGGSRLRDSYTSGIVAIVDDVVARLGGPSALGPRAQARVLAAYAAMFGTIQLARALTDATLSEQVVEEGVETVLTALGLAPGVPIND